MKSFQYTATNEWGEEISGRIDSQDFMQASEIIRNKGWYIVSLQEVEGEIQHMRSDVFSAFQSDESTHTDHRSYTIPVIDEDSQDQKTLHETSVQEPHKTHHIKVQDDSSEQPRSAPQPKATQEPKTSSVPVTPKEHVQSSESGILFSKNSTASMQKKPSFSDSDLDKIEQQVNDYIKENEQALQESTKQRLQHYVGKVDLLRETHDKRRLKNMQRELKRILKIADREVQEYQQKKWENYDKSGPGNHIDSYTEFDEKVKLQRAETKKELVKKTGFKKWIQMIDLPNEDDDNQVLVKQQYESIWHEAFLFSGVLLAFYLLAFFVAYYSKRAGVEDHFLIRIFDTTLFKQLVLILFSFFGLLGIRTIALPKRIKFDIPLVIAFALLVATILNT